MMSNANAMIAMNPAPAPMIVHQGARRASSSVNLRSL
jgi:hypothetical protein